LLQTIQSFVNSLQLIQLRAMSTHCWEFKGRLVFYWVAFYLLGSSASIAHPTT